MVHAVLAGAEQRSGVEHKLLSGERQLQAWADEAENAQPQTLNEAWDTLEVLIRAERDDAAIRLMPRVYALYLNAEAFYKYDPKLGRIGNSLLRLPQGRGKLCIAFFETFGAVWSPQEFGDHKKSIPVQFMQQAAWDDTRIVSWLYDRYQTALMFGSKKEHALHNMIYTLCPMPRAAQGWQDLYFQQLCVSPQGEEVFRKIKDDARQSPSDMRRLTIFLASLEYTKGFDPKDAGWLLKAFRKNPYGSWVVGCFVIGTGDIPTADMDIPKAKITEAFLKQALTTPLTAEACDSYRGYLQTRSSMIQPKRSDDLIRVMFRVTVMDGLNNLYLKLNRGKDAQRVMLEARKLRGKHNFPEENFLAGMTQAASGQRVVEAAIKAREEADESKPEYWMQRAAYYHGRKEPDEEEEALRRALALYDVAELPQQGGASNSYPNVFSSLFRFLWGQARGDEAVALFKTHRAAARYNAGVLSAMYYDCVNDIYIAKNGHFWKEVEPGLVEDLRDAYERLRALPKGENPHSNTCSDAYARLSVYLLSRYPELAMRSGVLNFDEDPFAWDALLMIDFQFAFPRCIDILLFPGGDKKQPPNEKSLQQLKGLANRRALDVNRLCEISGVLRNATDYETSNWFLQEAVKLVKFDTERIGIYAGLSANFRAMGDWQNSEKYISLSEKLDNVRVEDIVKALQQTADLAEKSGAPEAALRIRERIKNLGETPW